MTDLADTYAAWEAQRCSLAARDASDTLPAADEWHASDDEAVELLRKAAALLGWDKPTLPAWVQSEVDRLGVTLVLFGTLTLGSVTKGTPIWACTGDCCCWYVVDDGSFLDRYSLVNTGEACQGQECACHDLPRRDPAEKEDA